MHTTDVAAAALRVLLLTSTSSTLIKISTVKEQNLPFSSAWESDTLYIWSRCILNRSKALTEKSYFKVWHASRLESFYRVMCGQVMKGQVAGDNRHWMQSSHTSAVAENHRLTNKQNNNLHQRDSYTWRENEFTEFDKGQQGAFTVDRYNQGICHRSRK